MSSSQELFDKKISITGSIVQKNPYDIYEVGECRSFICSAKTPVAQCSDGDWTWKFRKCGMTCPQQPICSRPDPSLCPTFSGQRPQSIKFNSAPHLECTYNLSSFSTVADLQKWKEIFGQNKEYDQILIPAFCSKQSFSDCPLNQDGKIPASCSILRANNSAGDFCREWAKENPSLADQVKEEYCQKHNTFECACLNRDQEVEYRSFKEYLPEVPDSCWYRPCTQPEFNFIPESLSSPICPDGVCTQVNKGWDSKVHQDFSYSEAQNATICPLHQKKQKKLEEESFPTALILILALLGGLLIVYLIFIIIHDQKDLF